MTESRSAQLRQLLHRETLAVPGVFNAYTARLIERAGFKAAYVSGAGLSASRAVPDIGLLTLTETVMEARHIADAVHIPAIVDADTGYGDVQQVYRTIQEFETAGVAGIQLEDQTFPKRCGHLDGKNLVSTRAMCEKISAAVAAKKDSNLLIIARTDAHAIEGLHGAISRAKAYRDAGADAIFPEALETADDFHAFAQALDPSSTFLIANMTEWGKTPLMSVGDFSTCGYHLVLFPMTLFRVMGRALEEALWELHQQGTQKNLLPRMQTRTQLYEVLGYQTYGQFEQRIKERQNLHGDCINQARS